MIKNQNMKKNPPKPIEPFELFSKDENPLEWCDKSLWENIVNPTTHGAFFKNEQNTKKIKEILYQTDLFERENFRLLQSKVIEIAQENKLLQNIDYEAVGTYDPHNDGYQTLTIKGWRQHVFNIIYCIRANPVVYRQFLTHYDKWLKIYKIYCSGEDKDNITSDLYEIGF